MNKFFHPQRCRMHCHKVTGFTLIELMITVAIVAILAAIAYPSYQNQIMRTHRNAAKACLSQYAQFMERYYTTRFTYIGANPVLGCSTESNMNQRYTFSIGVPTQNTFTATATPVNGQLSQDTRCGTLSLNQIGDRGAGTGSTTDIAYCW